MCMVPTMCYYMHACRGIIMCTILHNLDRAHLHHNKDKVLAEVRRPGMKPVEWK